MFIWLLTLTCGSFLRLCRMVFSKWELYLKYLIVTELRTDFPVRFCFIMILVLWTCDNLVFSIYLNSAVPAENYETGLCFHLKLRFCPVNCARSSWKTLTEHLLVNGELPHVFYLYLPICGIPHTVSLFKYIEVDVLYFDAVKWIVHF